MAYKLTAEECQHVLADDTELIYQIRLGKLYAELSLATQPHLIYRIQGRIAELIEIMGLRDKAENQLNHK